MYLCPKCGSDRTAIGDWVVNEEGTDEVGVGTQCFACGYHSHDDEEDEQEVAGVD